MLVKSHILGTIYTYSSALLKWTLLNLKVHNYNAGRLITLNGFDERERYEVELIRPFIRQLHF